MTILTDILLLAIVIYVIGRVHKTNQSKSADALKVSAAQTQPSLKTKSGDTITGTLQIPNTQKFTGAWSFVKGFGVDPRRVLDLVSYRANTTQQLPVATQQALQHCYEKGSAFGLETMEMVCKGKPLEQGSVLYFALVAYGQRSADDKAELVAFVAAPV